MTTDAVQVAPSVAPRWVWMTPIALALLSLALSAYANYTVNDKALTGRVIALEVKQATTEDTSKQTQATLTRIEGTVNTIRVDVATMKGALGAKK